MTRLSEKQAAARLGEIEQQYDLFALTLDGWVAWRAVRSVIGLALTGMSVEHQRAASYRPSLFRMVFEVAVLVVNVLIAKPRTLLVKTYGSALRERQEGMLRDIYFDSLLASGLEAHKVHQSNATGDVRRAQMLYPYHTSQSAIAALARVLAMVHVRGDTKRVAKKIAAALTALPEISLEYRWLLRRLESTRWQAYFYYRLLRAVRPKAVLVADAGEYALNIACKRHGTTFVELQHGIFTENHPDAIPAYALKCASPAALLLPDVLAVYGNYWARRLQSTALAAQRIVCVGSDALDRWRDRRRAGRRAASERIEIVVTTQGLERERLVDWIMAVADRAPSERPWRIVVKLHPIYDGDPGPYVKLAAYSSIQLIGPESPVSVYELLIAANVHASISSASHYDALGLGVPTVVVPLPGSELVADLVDGLTVFTGNDPDVLWACAQRDLQDAASSCLNDDFYAEGFVPRMRSVLA